MRYLFFLIFLVSFIYANQPKKFAYIVSDERIPFWNIMSKGIKDKSKQLGYEIKIYSSNNLKNLELKNTVQALNDDISGLIISPINSSTASTLLKLANKKNIPTVIADIGTDEGEYVSYISSNNINGAYKIGKVLAKKMQELNYDKNGSVGIIAIPQKRENGKARTIGFLNAMDEAKIKVDGLLQQVDFSYEETYNYTLNLIDLYPQLRAIWLQGSDRYKGALDAIKKRNKQDEILLICFDAEPEFITMIQKGELVGSAMQQPYLMGSKAVENLVKYLKGEKIDKELQLEILPISQENIYDNLSIIKQNVLGIRE